MSIGNSLAIQWLGLSTFTAEGPGSVPGRGTKILKASRCGQKKKKKQLSIIAEMKTSIGGLEDEFEDI